VSAATVEAIDLTKTYADGTNALDTVTFAAAPGEVFGLLGPNGSGKTTTVRIFVTLLQPSEGTARIAGVDVTRDRERVRELIGYAGQYVGVDHDLTITENLVQTGRLHGMTVKEARRRSDELIDSLGLTGVAHQRAGRLSGGMRRRLDLAQAMVHRPAALFLDEPTTGLDPQARKALWEQLQLLAGDGTTIVLTTQYLEEADRFCGRVAILDRGAIVATGTPSALKDAAGSDRVTITLTDPSDTRQWAHAARVASTVPGVVNVAAADGTVTVQLRAADTTLLELVRGLDVEGIDVARLELTPTTLDDVFLTYTGLAPRTETESEHRSTSVFAAIHGGGIR
jgi:daunorubicin resistance ABC transporter ATP-binding subunit